MSDLNIHNNIDDITNLDESFLLDATDFRLEFNNINNNDPSIYLKIMDYFSNIGKMITRYL